MKPLINLARHAALGCRVTVPLILVALLIWWLATGPAWGWFALKCLGGAVVFIVISGVIGEAIEERRERGR